MDFWTVFGACLAANGIAAFFLGVAGLRYRREASLASFREAVSSRPKPAFYLISCDKKVKWLATFPPEEERAARVCVANCNNGHSGLYLEHGDFCSGTHALFECFETPTEISSNPS